MEAPNTLLPLTIRGANLPHTPKPAASPSSDLGFMADKYCFGYDWIEFTATQNLKTLPEQPFLFSHEDAGHGTSFYRNLYKIETVYHGQFVPFATMATQNRTPFIADNIVQVKIDNRFCYTPDLPGVIQNFCREYNLTFKNFTRLDLFIDFQKIQGFDDNIQAFLKACSGREIIMKGKSMTTHHKRAMITGITWGSRSSGTAITIYNKTVEMMQKTWKPWIEQLWREAHFDMDKDVYRLEFSLKKFKNDIVTVHGETLNLFHECEMMHSAQLILEYCVQQHLQFAFNKDGERFSRLKRYYLLNWNSSKYFPKTYCVKPKSNNYTKAYIKRLAVDALFYQKKNDYMHSSGIYSHILNLVERHGLHKWFGRRMHWLDIKKQNFSIFDRIVIERSKTTPLYQSSLI